MSKQRFVKETNRLSRDINQTVEINSHHSRLSSAFALQLAKLLGAKVIVISSSDDKLKRAAALGADESINYTNVPEWSKAVKKLTRGDGVDHIVDVGGEKTLPQSLRVIRPGGTISMIGVLSGVNM